MAERAPGRTRSRGIPRTPLIAATAFGRRLDAARVAAALARGLHAGGLPPADVCLLEPAPPERSQAGARAPDAGLASLLAELDFDVRMRAARAVVLAAHRLEEPGLQESAAFEIATRARQAGVPCFAVTSRDRLDAFDARMLDLQLAIEAASPGELTSAGRRVGQLL